MDIGYVRIDDATYVLKPVEAHGVDINDELKAYYEARLETMQKAFGDVVKADLNGEWDRQARHLLRYRDNNNITVPPELYKKALMVWNGRLMQARTVIYSPTKIVTSKSWLRDSRYNDDNAEVFFEALGDYEETDVLLVTVKKAFETPLHILYDRRADIIYIPNIRTFHSFSDYKLCTGGSTGEQFWGQTDAELQETMDTINMFSLAVSTVQVKNVDYSLSKLLNENTIVNVEKRRGTEWRA